MNYWLRNRRPRNKRVTMKRVRCRPVADCKRAAIIGGTLVSLVDDHISIEIVRTDCSPSDAAANQSDGHASNGKTSAIGRPNSFQRLMRLNSCSSRDLRATVLITN